MNDNGQPKEQLLTQLADLRRQVAELKQSEAAYTRAEETLRISEERLRQITSSIREVVWLRDINTLEMLYVSPAYEEVWGRSCESLYQTPASFLEAVHPDDIDRLMHAIRKQYDGTPFDQEYRIIRPDGSVRWIWGRTFLIHNEAGEIYRAAALAEDITVRKLAEAALRQSNAELQTRNEELDAYAHTVAHDLKNPLGNLLGYAETLAEYYTLMSDEERLDALRVVIRNGFKMDSIIDELLMLSEVRRTDVVTGPLNMSRIVAEVLRRLSDAIANTHAEIKIPDEWPAAEGYAPWIEEAWLNYLSNALKYGGQPPHIQLGATTQATGQICFWVRDDGRGIAPEDQARLFTPFTRLSLNRAKGHGLGLSIVRRIVEKLGGQVKVESDGATGHGSIFSFTLPGAIAQATGKDPTIP